MVPPSAERERHTIPGGHLPRNWTGPCVWGGHLRSGVGLPLSGFTYRAINNAARAAARRATDRRVSRSPRECSRQRERPYGFCATAIRRVPSSEVLSTSKSP
jgi:hypothetical protein